MLNIFLSFLHHKRPFHEGAKGCVGKGKESKSQRVEKSKSFEVKKIKGQTRTLSLSAHRNDKEDCASIPSLFTKRKGNIYDKNEERKILQESLSLSCPESGQRQKREAVNILCEKRSFSQSRREFVKYLTRVRSIKNRILKFGIFVFLLLITHYSLIITNHSSLFINHCNATTGWTTNATTCDSSYLSIDCPESLKICGYVSSTLYCANPTTINAALPSSAGTADDTDVQGSGGYQVNCTQTTYDCTTPADVWDCKASSTCATKNLKTTCAGSAHTSSCSTCLTGYLDCDGVGTGVDTNGCEIEIGGACTNNGVAGTYGASCVGSSPPVCNTGPVDVYTGTLAEQSTTNPLFWGKQYSTGDLFNVSKNGGNSVVIDNDGNMGIGTTSPLARLQAVGTEGNPASSGTAVTGHFVLGGEGNNNVLQMGTQDASPYGAWLQVANKTNLGTEYNLLLNPNGGNVGIGKYGNLAYALDMTGSLMATGQIVSGQGTFMDADGDGWTGMQADGSEGTANLIFWIADDEAVYINSSGNVGIGTTSPTALLNVSGPAGAPGAVDLSTEELTVEDGDVLGKIEFDAPLESDGTDAILVGAAIEAVAEGTFAADNNATELVFKTGASEAATQKMVITSGGNVGIGTTSPTEKLHVSGDIKSKTVISPILIGGKTEGDKLIYKSTLGVGGTIAHSWRGGNNLQYVCDTTDTGWQRCADDNGADSGGTYGAGKSLKAVGQGTGTDDIGFSGLLSGYLATSGSFYNLGSYLYLWSSTPSGLSDAWRRNINTSSSTVLRSALNRGAGFSVRCLRTDNTDTSDFTDTRDGTVYPVVKIGNQVWMTKNLAYLPSVNAVADGSESVAKYYVYGYDGTDVATAKATANYTDYGVLYNYPGALAAAPDGFTVPTDEELNELELATLEVIAETAGDDLMTILTNGNVGIGTESPGAKLSVQTTGTTDILNLFETGGTEVMTVLENGNVGIGTTSPGDKLTVSGGDIMLDTDERLEWGSTSYIVSGENNLGIRVADGGSIDFRTDASGGTKMTIIDSGNVGIGTTTPATLLTIANDNWISAIDNVGTGSINMMKVNADDEIEFGAPLNIGSLELSDDSGLVKLVDMGVSSTPSSGTVEGYALAIDATDILTVQAEADGSGGTQNEKVTIDGDFEVTGTSTLSNMVISTDTIGAPLNTDMNFQTGTSSLATRMTIADDGNVGIGTTSPGEKLEVTGNISLSNNIYFKTAATGIFTDTADGTDNKDIRFGGGGSASSSRGAVMILAGNEHGVYPGQFIINAGEDAGAQVKIDSTLNVGNGKVGIGTTSPSAKLDISDTTPVLKLTNEQSLSSPNWNGVTMGDIDFKTSDGSGGGIGTVARIRAINTVLNTNDPQVGFSFWTGSTTSLNEALRINHLGKVGIGMIDSTAKLGITAISTTSTGTGLKVEGATGAGGRAIVHFDSTGSSNERYSLRVTGDNEAIEGLVVTEAGNVGIGTTSPGAKLDVEASSATDGINVKKDSNWLKVLPKLEIDTFNPLVEKGDSGIIFSNGTTDYGNFIIAPWSSNNYGIVIKGTTGNVGIGLNDPGEKLSVAGNVMIGDGAWSDGTTTGDLAIQGNVGIGTTSPQNKLDIEGGAVIGVTYSGTNTAPTNGLLVEGNVGIGTTSPLSALHVNGGTGTLSTGLTFGDGDSGLYEYADDTIFISTGGSMRWEVGGNIFGNASSGKSALYFETPSATNPNILPNRSDNDTGIGYAGTDQLSLIAGAKEIARLSEATTEQLIVNPQGDLTGTAAAPTLAFGDGDSGFYESSDDVMRVSIGGTAKYLIDADKFQGIDTNNYFYLSQIAATATAPIYVFRGDVNTGIGHAAADQLSLISGGVEMMRLVEDTENYIEVAENDMWLKWRDNAGTGTINAIKVNADDELEFGSAINIGTMDFSDDSGAITFLDMGVTSSASADTEESYSFAIDATDILSVKAESDGSGGIQDPQVIIGKGGSVIGDTAEPSLAFGDGDTGFYESADDNFSLISGGTELVKFVNDTTDYIEVAVNDMWLKWTDNAGTGTINAIKTNASDEIEFGTAINIGTLDLSDDSGLVTLVDMGVTATPAAGVVEGYNFAVDATDILTVYAEADGSGGIQNSRVGIGTTSPTGLLTLNETPGALQATPTLAFGDGDSGFYESSDDTLNVAITGLNRWSFAGATFGGATGTRFEIKNVDATATVPVFIPNGGDENTGIGHAAADQLSLISGGVEGIRINTATSGVNYLDVTPSATTAAVQIATAGTDTNINLSLMPKGTGDVGINDTTPSYKLDVNGTIRGFTITDSSDVRLKKNITPLQNALSKVLSLQGVNYQWIDETKDQSLQMGLIAQEVEEVVPEVVLTDDEGYKSIAYSKLTSLLIEAVKEINSMVETLAANIMFRFEVQDTQIEAQQIQIELLEQRLNALELQ